MIKKEKWDKLSSWMSELKIQHHDLVEKFITGRGKGGQKLNKTASVVYLYHLPSKIAVKCQKSRLREDNRYFARLQLCEKLHALTSNTKTKKQLKQEKIKHQKKRRARRAKELPTNNKERSS
jgi:protein subunit release factor B